MDTGYPHQEGKKHDPPEHIHRPEFIIVDEEGQGRQKSQHKKEETGFASFEELSDVRFPFSIRIVSLGLSFLMVMSSIAALLGVIFAGLVTLLTFGYFEKSKAFLKRCNSWWRKSTVLALGFFVAIFSPSFGFAIIIIYFLMLGEKINHDILRRMLHSATR